MTKHYKDKVMGLTDHSPGGPAAPVDLSAVIFPNWREVLNQSRLAAQIWEPKDRS